MRAFPVPVQITDEERLFGGILSLRQFLYIIGGVALGGVAFFLTFMPVMLRLFLFLLVALLGPVFSFVAVQNMKVDKLLYFYLKWRFSPKSTYHRRYD